MEPGPRPVRPWFRAGNGDPIGRRVKGDCHPLCSRRNTTRIWPICDTGHFFADRDRKRRAPTVRPLASLDGFIPNRVRLDNEEQAAVSEAQSSTAEVDEMRRDLAEFQKQLAALPELDKQLQDLAPQEKKLAKVAPKLHRKKKRLMRLRKRRLRSRSRQLTSTDFANRLVA